ncbi:EamA family transporter [Shouchella shacheensis]|uniref:EamA family transporter n=1 Tax=Shouchella shacheensis TaxID=1649580 RepID=UPI00073FD6AC|nr:EamA family transporter [Shouchella shacheensis]
MWFVFALAAACCFGLRGILYQWTSQKPIDRNLLLFGVYVSGTTIAITGNLFAQQQWSDGAWYGILMGIFSFLANASMYRGYAVGRPSVIALFSGLPPFVVVVVAYIAWGEVLTTWQLFAFLIMILGLLCIKYSHDLKTGGLKGIQWGIMTMLFFGLTDVSVKQSTLAGAATLPALIVMFATGSLCFGFAWMLSNLNKKRAVRTAHGEQAAAEDGHVCHTDPNWSLQRTFGWGMIVGITNVAGMMFVLPAFREGTTGIVSAISAMNVVIIILYARFFLKEELAKNEVMGLALAFLGIIVLRLNA